MRCLFAVLLISACGVDSGDDVGRCAVLEGKTFQSVDDQGDCGLGPDGGGSCHWSVAFDRLEPSTTQFEYRYSDIGESGAAGCSLDDHALDISAASEYTDRLFVGRYDLATGRLTWDGLVFAP